MKKIIITIIASIILISTAAYAQDSTYQAKNTEIGIRMSNFNDFGFIYKKQRKENRFFRLRASGFNFGSVNSATLIGLQTALGSEKRKLISERLQFIIGPEFSLAVAFSSEGDFTYSISNSFFGGNTDIFVSSGEGNLLLAPSIGYILGFQYEINDKFLLSIETIPSLQVVLLSEAESPIFNLGFNTQAVAITIAHKFNKLKKKKK